jgi:hypothetical protein
MPDNPLLTELAEVRALLLEATRKLEFATILANNNLRKIDDLEHYLKIAEGRLLVIDEGRTD